jgi:hypothetical protein
MAKIQEEIYVIRLSKLQKSGQEQLTPFTDDNFRNALDAWLNETLGELVEVEVEKTQ